MSATAGQAAAAVQSATSADGGSICSASAATFSFGLIADVQYSTVDCSDGLLGLSYATEPDPVTGEFPLLYDVPYARRYAQALGILRAALDTYCSRGLSTAVLLGDLLDGATTNERAGPGGVRLPRTVEECHEKLLGVLREHGSSRGLAMHAAFGNNDARAVGRKVWARDILPLRHASLGSSGAVGPQTPPSHGAAQERGEEPTADRLYYEYLAAPGVRFVVLDAYDEAALPGYASSDAARETAAAFLAAANPLSFPRRVPWTPLRDIPRSVLHLMDYNGRCGATQLEWLRAVLARATAAGERVLVFCHVPCHPAVCKPDALLWNYQDMLALLRAPEAACVQAFLSGHDHDGGYFCDRGGAEGEAGAGAGGGVHHLVPPAPLECSAGGSAYGILHVRADALELEWFGDKRPPPGTLQGGGSWPPTRMEYRRPTGGWGAGANGAGTAAAPTS